MAKFRKKPVEIEAFQWTGNQTQLEDPDWIVDEILKGDVWFDLVGTPEVKMKITTLEGVMSAQPGDWIIQGIAGEIYPCKPDIFEKTYEAV